MARTAADVVAATLTAPGIAGNRPSSGAPVTASRGQLRIYLGSAPGVRNQYRA